MDDFRVLNSEGLRFQDEFVRHKILDTIGDLSLMGYELAGKVTTFKSGHHIHNLLCRKILQNPDCFEIVSIGQLKESVQETFKLPQDIRLPV